MIHEQSKPKKTSWRNQRDTDKFPLLGSCQVGNVKCGQLLWLCMDGDRDFDICLLLLFFSVYCPRLLVKYNNYYNILSGVGARRISLHDNKQYAYIMCTVCAKGYDQIIYTLAVFTRYLYCNIQVYREIICLYGLSVKELFFFFFFKRPRSL